jgi:hypothetical protein
MTKKWITCLGILGFSLLLSGKAGRACTYTGGVTCNTFLGTVCDGECDGDVCAAGMGRREYSCSDGTVQFDSE